MNYNQSAIKLNHTLQSWIKTKQTNQKFEPLE